MNKWGEFKIHLFKGWVPTEKDDKFYYFVNSIANIINSNSKDAWCWDQTTIYIKVG